MMAMAEGLRTPALLVLLILLATQRLTLRP